MTRRRTKGRDIECDTAADLLFREDARRLGYLGPGERGLWAYYTDRGMVPPDKFHQIISVRELTNTDPLIGLTIDETGQFPRAPRYVPPVTDDR